MLFKTPNLAFATGLVISSFLLTSVTAQEINQEHLSAGKKAVAATQATLSFDAILFNTSAKLKNRLTAKDPNKADHITSVVDEEALALAPRRGILEGEAGRLFAGQFSEIELNEIAAFFSSDTGKKYLGKTPLLARELSKSARIWANGISNDMAKKVLERLAEPNN